MKKLLFFCLSFLISFTPIHGQTFGVEQSFSKKVVLPTAVYKLLLKDDDVNDTLKSAKIEKKSIKSIKKQFFQATSINIDNNKLPDLLVKGQSDLLGANTTHFWVFKGTSKGYILVFTVTTSGLSILKSMSKGHRIIKSSYPSGSKAITDYFRFDGKEYVYSWSKTEYI